MNDAVTYETLDELGKIYVPYLKRYGECEQFHTPLVDLERMSKEDTIDIMNLSYLETLFEVVVLLQKRSIVDNDLSVCYPELENLVIDSLSSFNGTYRLL